MSNCPNCRALVEGAANYCVNCGSRLPVVCSNCGAANQPDSRFCHACGSGLGAIAPSPRPYVSLSCPRCHSTNEPDAIFCYSCGLPLEEFSGRPEGGTLESAAPAGFWIRLLGWLLDSILLAAVQLALLALLPGMSIEAYFAEESLWTRYDTILILVTAAYHTAGVSVFSTTVGKRALGLYVLRQDGSRVGPLRAFVRYAAYIPSSLFLGAGFLMIGFSSDKRGLHDRICGTVVVKK